MIDFDSRRAVVKDFREWLTTKDPDEEYDYVSHDNCAFAQYLKDRGHINPVVSAYYWNVFENGYRVVREMPFDIDNAVVRADPRTFGNVAKYMELHD